jgi:hypothetical protein
VVAQYTLLDHELGFGGKKSELRLYIFFFFYYYYYYYEGTWDVWDGGGAAGRGEE